MTAKQYMHKIRNIRRRIRLLMEQIERDTTLASGVTAIRYDKDIVQTSPVGDRMTDIVAKIIDTTKDLEEEIHQLQLYEEECTGLLLQLDEQFERLLTYHYVDGYSWTEVTDLMHYTGEKYVYEVKDKALAALDEVLKNMK